MALTISVIVPTHDRPESLTKAVESILAQTRRPDELIVVNDGTREAPDEIERRAAAAEVPFCCIRRQGASSSASRNAGLAAARGDVAALIDDDMVLAADYLNRLAALYEADSAGVVAGIGALYTLPSPPPVAQRVWDAIAAALAENRWATRRCAARYVPLPPGLRGRLVPARRLAGGAISLRRRVYAACRFTEAFGGYSLGEDTEFSFRVGRTEALFIAPELVTRHEMPAGGRPDPHFRGRMYAANMLYIARRGVDGGAGTWLLLYYHLVCMALLAAAWGALSLRGRNLRLAKGIAGELLRDGLSAVRSLLCGC
jgi:glycosyltransferase involved in cell wall biosynthesis